MGLFSGSSTTKSNSSFDTGPSSFQKPYLDTSFNSAQDIYNQQKDTPYYQGETYAGMSSGAQDALAKLRAYASGTGLGTATTLGDIGSTASGYYGKAGSTVDQYAAMAGQDPTQANIASATAYANNPAIDGMVDAASRDVTRNLNESELPSIDRAASATGNINSSRAGVASGIAQRGAADRVADISSTLRGQAYQTGLGLAQNDRQTNLSALGNAAGMYTGLGSDGVSALGKANDAAYNAYGAITGSYDKDQADRQGQDDAALQKWQGQDTRANDLLNRYNSVVESSQWGQSGTSSSTSKTKQAQGLLNQLMGAGLMGASIYTGLGSKSAKA